MSKILDHYGNPIKVSKYLVIVYTRNIKGRVCGESYFNLSPDRPYSFELSLSYIIDNWLKS